MADEREPLEPQDTKVRKKTRRWWMWLPGAFMVVLLVVALAWWLVVGAWSRSKWTQFQGKQEALRAKVLGRSTERVPLDGQKVPGNAWDHYSASMAAFDKLPEKDRTDLIDATVSKPKPETSARAYAVLDANPGILGEIREGAKCDSCTFPYEWDRGSNMPLPFLAGCRRASRIVAVEARRRRELKDLDGAIDCVALCYQLGADTGRRGLVISGLVGIAIRGMGSVEAAKIATDAGLRPEQAERLEKLTEKAEADFEPLHYWMEADQLQFGYSILWDQSSRGEESSVGETDELRQAGVPSWRHGFSWRITFTHIADVLEQETRCIEAAEKLAWPEALKKYDAFVATITDDPELARSVSAPQSCDSSCRASIARLRLIRALCQERRTGAAASPLPADPHTLAPIHRRAEEGRVVYWAEWSNGDQGGKGEFGENPGGENPGDIVLEWQK